MANEKILVVDDDKNICELLRLYLVKEGYNVTMVHDGSAALTEFDKLHPDLVLLDVMMPVMDGYEATAEIRKVSASVPIIAVTAYAFAQDEQRIINSGFDAYTAKPINGKILKDKISTLLTHRIILM